MNETITYNPDNLAVIMLGVMLFVFFIGPLMGYGLQQVVYKVWDWIKEA